MASLQGGGASGPSVTGEAACTSKPHKECLSVPLGKQWQPSSSAVYTHLISMLPCSATPSLNLAAGDGRGGGCGEGEGATHHSCLSGTLAEFRNTSLPFILHPLLEVLLGRKSGEAQQRRNSRSTPGPPGMGGHCIGGEQLWEAAPGE